MASLTIMTPNQFLTLAQILPEPLLLVTSMGEILAVNQAATKLFDKTSKALMGQCITELVTDSPETVIDYLRICSQSRQMILGALTIHQAQGEGIACRSQGAVLQPRSLENPAINILRLEKRTSNQFVLLNQKIHALSQEIQHRQSTQADLARSNETLNQTLINLQNALKAVQTEKMSGLRQLVAGIAHEINNPISFIHGNIDHASEYYDELLKLIQLYQQEYPQPSRVIQQTIESLDLKFIQEDIKSLLQSMRVGSQRISEIVTSLRNFSRLDEATFKMADIHEGLEATLMILQSRLNPNDKHSGIKVIKDYGQLPPIHCFPGQLNQVFMHLLNNAIDALEEANQKRSPEEIIAHPNTIWIRTCLLTDNQVVISIADNGIGIPDSIQCKVFDPFFTTKSVGKGTGLGLSVSYQIVVENHAGSLEVKFELDQRTEFCMRIPIHAK